MGFSSSILVTKPDDFKLDIPHFEAALRERWPEVEFTQVIADDVDFNLVPSDGSLEFAGVILSQDQVAWWGSFESFAAFLLWFRKYPSSGYELLVTEAHDDIYFIMQTDTTKTEIIKVLEGEQE